MMSRVSKYSLLLLIGGVGAVAIFLVYSFGRTFDNWPWTVRTIHRSGEAYGFAIGASKEVAFETALENQRNRILSGLHLLDEPPTTYAKKYKGRPIRHEDEPRVLNSDEWYFPLPECNCWMIVHFKDQRVHEIHEFRYFGPTE